MLSRTKAITAAAAAGLMLVAIAPATASLASPATPGAAQLTASSSPREATALPVDATFMPSLARNLAVTGPDKAGDPVVLEPDTGAPSQVWTVVSPSQGDTVTTIVNKQTGLCLTADQLTAGTTVTAAKCDGSLGQQWIPFEFHNGMWELVPYGGMKIPLYAAAGVGTDLVRLSGPVSTEQVPLLEWVWH